MSKTCKECGCQMEDNARFCPQCGCPVKEVKESAPMEPEKVENENEDKKSPSDETSFKLTIVLINWHYCYVDSYRLYLGKQDESKCPRFRFCCK